MKVPVYNQKGEKISEVTLPKEIFEVKISPDLVHQIVVSQASNRRSGTAHAKERGEVRGGGKKPWRQKGTGRARHGSIRSPIWKGGGVTFGPRKEKVYKKTIPKKMRRSALLMVLSGKAKENLLIVLDSFKIDNAKTKTMVRLLNSLPCKDQSCLIALSDSNKEAVLSARNIPKVVTEETRNLNVLDLLSSKYLLISKDSIKTIKDTFLEKDK